MIVFKAVYQIDHDCFQSFSIEDNCGYCLHYEIGKVTKAVSGSLGIFCFRTLEDADCFMYINGCETKDEKIIELETVGRLRHLPRQIPSPYNVNEFYDKSTPYWEIEFLEPPIGTILAEAVGVIRVVE